MEKDIIHIAIERLKETLRQKVYWTADEILDGTITIEFNNHKFKIPVEVKNEFRKHHVQQLTQKLLDNNLNEVMVIANKILPNAKEELRNTNIAYLETNGNLYIKTDYVWLWIDNNKPLKIQKELGNRAFTKAGLKVLFQFIIDKNLVNQPHRTIANKANVALGNIPLIINGLKETGFLLHLNKREYLWKDRKVLINRWITEYEIKLKPSLLKGKFKLRKNWNELNLKTGVTLWGGEPAGDILTNHLRPEVFTLYTNEDRVNLLKNYLLAPDLEGDVEVYEMFWKKDDDFQTAPPFLVYADLILADNKRCRETAKIIFDEFIEPII